MKEYLFDARTQEGLKYASSIYATSEKEALDALAQKGLFVLSVKEKTNFVLQKSLSLDEIWLFTQKLLALTKGGISLGNALEQILKTTKNQQAALIIETCIEQINEGNQFHTVAKRFPELFDDLFVSALMTADKTGNLLEALLHYQTFLIIKIKTRKKIINALVYPSFLIATLIIIMAILFTFVLPKFIDLYADMETQLPFLTRLLINIVDHLFLYTCLIATISFVLFKVIKRINLKVPIISNLIETINSAYIARLLATMLLSGATIVESLEVAFSSLNHSILKNKIKAIINDIEQGISLAVSFDEHHIFSELGSDLIRIGENSGQLPAILLEISAFYEMQLDNKINNLTTLIEPIIMLMIGVIIGIVIISMYLPIFSMVEIVK